MLPVIAWGTGVIETIAEIGSTNAELVRLIAQGDVRPEGFWLVADRQTAGRGRQHRPWFDGHGNFMGSTVVHQRPGDPPLQTLALVAGLAVHSVASQFAGAAQCLLKWPNDLMVGRAKLAGILLERSGNAVIVGIGVNLAVAPSVEGRETVALGDLGPTPERNHFATSLAAAFTDELATWRTLGLSGLIPRWLERAHDAGTALSVGEPGEIPIHGTFAGLDREGALILTLPDGTTKTIHAGEVRLG